jgi:hypothetical protein
MPGVTPSGAGGRHPTNGREKTAERQPRRERRCWRRPSAGKGSAVLVATPGRFATASPVLPGTFWTALARGALTPQRPHQ